MLDITAHKAAQAADAERWNAAGQKIGKRALSSTTLEVARKAVTKVTETKTRSAMNEPVADLMELRSDAGLQRAMDEDMTASSDAVEEVLLEAMEDGLDSEMRWQVTQFSGMNWELGDEDRMMLSGYPIQGHTAHEISAYMHEQLRYEVAGIAAGPVDGSTLVATVPEQLSQLVERFGGRVGGAVQEAYYAGVQLAVRMIAEAISNAS